jgi:hypothetical protein
MNLTYHRSGQGEGGELAAEPDDEIEVEDIDVEAVTDEVETQEPLVEAAGLGVDLPEADVLDQRRELPDAEDDEER